MEFYKDWIASGEDIVPWTVEKEPCDFPSFLAFIYSADSEEKARDTGFVPHSTYWLMDEEDRLVGAVNIRHRLNEHLLNCGGHIGYGIRPSYRRRGYAAVLLSEAIGVASKMGLKRILLVCDKGNIGSEKTILRQGGEFESEFTEADGNVVRRFWIRISDTNWKYSKPMDKSR